MTITTKLGNVQGIRHYGIDFFGGLPYAAPPVGNLRWAPPQEPVGWKPHTLDATRFGPDCWQVVDPVMNPLADQAQMSEDCLYLNVYTPAGAAHAAASAGRRRISSTSLLPVMVWFHGGAFQQGAGRRPEYDGRRIAERDMVVVTINYRLGALGFLVSSVDGIFGNFGLMDQRAALYWIQDHIASFGGNPNAITVFGESAGAVMIGLHLLMMSPTDPSSTPTASIATTADIKHHWNTTASPRQRPPKKSSSSSSSRPKLFHRAILQSNPMGYKFRSIVVADFLGDALKRTVDCRDLACLRAEPVEEIMRAQSMLMGVPRSVGDFFPWGPTLTQELHMTILGGAGGGGGGRSGDKSMDTSGRSSSSSSSPSSSSSSSYNARRSSSSQRISGVEYSLLNALEQRSLFQVEKYQKHRESTKFAVNVSQPLLTLESIPDEIPVIIGTNQHEGEMFVHSAFPLPMAKAVYWMFVGALFKDSASRVLKHYRPYVDQVEREAQIIAEQQIHEEENKQYYLEHRDELEKEYEMLVALNASRQKNQEQLVDPETVERLFQTLSSGGHFGFGDDQPSRQELTESNTSNSVTAAATSWDPRHLWPFSKQKLSESERAQKIAHKRAEREEKRKQRERERLLKQAAKVVVDYRPVMSRIITDYLFRCPSWHFAHTLSLNRVQKGKKNNVYVYRFSQPTHVIGFKECWGKVSERNEKNGNQGFVVRWTFSPLSI